MSVKPQVEKKNNNKKTEKRFNDCHIVTCSYQIVYHIVNHRPRCLKKETKIKKNGIKICGVIMGRFEMNQEYQTRMCSYKSVKGLECQVI